MGNALLYYLIVINVVTFLVYGIDKWKAKQGSWRISEATLLILAVIGGSIGALLGMKVWRHKTQHRKFKYGLPLGKSRGFEHSPCSFLLVGLAIHVSPNIALLAIAETTMG